MSHKILISNSKYKTLLATAFLSPVFVFTAYNWPHENIVSIEPSTHSKQPIATESLANEVMTEEQVVSHLKSIVPGIPITRENIIHHERVGMYQFSVQGTIFYISDDGTSIVKGDVFDTAMMNYDPSRANLTEQFNRALAFANKEQSLRPSDEFEFVNRSNASEVKELLSLIPDETTITFEPTSGNPPTDTFYVFYALDCETCGLFYPEITDLQSMGYRVKVLLVSPRGKQSQAFSHSQKILCQSSPITEFNIYTKKGFSGFSRNDCAISLDKNHEAFTALAIRGTPSVVRLSDSKVFEGLHYAGELASN